MGSRPTSPRRQDVLAAYVAAGGSVISVPSQRRRREFVHLAGSGHETGRPTFALAAARHAATPSDSRRPLSADRATDREVSVVVAAATAGSEKAAAHRLGRSRRRHRVPCGSAWSLRSSSQTFVIRPPTPGPPTCHRNVWSRGPGPARCPAPGGGAAAALPAAVSARAADGAACCAAAIASAGYPAV